MTKTTQNSRFSKLLQSPLPVLAPALPVVFEDLRLSVDRFCLLAGVEALGEMLTEDAEALCGPRHARTRSRQGHRWGQTRSAIAYHGGKVKVVRPRVRGLAGKEMALPSWELLSDPDLLQAWAMNLMLLSVSTRKYGRAVRLPGAAGGDLPARGGDATSKSAVSRRFVALTRKKLKAWLASDLSDLDLLVIQIDGLHVGDHVMLAAIGIDGGGEKHVLGLAEGASENAATVQALLDNLTARGLDPAVPRLFILDGAKALSKAVRRTFGAAAAIQRCQVHKGRNIIERLDESLHAGVKKALRQAWDQDDAEKAERLLKNLARRLELEAPGVSASILEGLDEILTVIRLGLPPELRRSLACTNAIENALGTVRTVQRNVKRWRNAEMALRWTAAGLLEAKKTFRRLKAYRQLPILKAALQEHMKKEKAKSAIETIKEAA
jgi:transposase-like protein